MPEIGRERLFPRSAPAKSRCRAQTYRVGTGRHFVRPRNSPLQPPFRTGSRYHHSWDFRAQEQSAVLHQFP